MDSQGRSRLLIGALTLGAIVLVISLLLSQQSAGIPAAVESPLINANVENGTAVAPVESPLAEPGPESPLGSPSGSAGAAVAESSGLTESVAITGSSEITEHGGITETNTISETGSDDAAVAASPALTEPITASVQSTVTVALAGSGLESSAPALYTFEVVASYPHDAEAYTQGLQYVDGTLYEGTGLHGQSTLRRVDLESGTVEQQVALDDEYFGEGIYVLEDRIYQLTWQSRVAFLYDRESFELVGEFDYPTEGWGLTYDGQALIMSDGSATLFRRDPETFDEIGRISVTERGQPVNLLNELEFIDGKVWANIWLTDEIVIIDPANGHVTGRVNLAGILSPEEAAGAEVLNGIAYDEENDRIFVTGKFWPKLFEIELVPR
jgi:glutamine cyclotransferase